MEKFKYMEMTVTNQTYIHKETTRLLPFSSESFVFQFSP